MNNISGTVSVIDTATNMVTNDANTVLVIDTGSNTVVGTPIAVGTYSWGIALTQDGKHAYVANLSSNNVSVIDTATNLVVATVPVGTGPSGVSIAGVPVPDPCAAIRTQLAKSQRGRLPNPRGLRERVPRVGRRAL